jgi:hypothetical protein
MSERRWALPDVVTRITSRAETNCKGCLIWTGAVDWSGYARIHHQGRNWKASRLIWLATHGKLDDGLFVLHSCDDRRCVNIDHLFLGTNAENMADMVRKGRSPRSRAKLSSEQVAAIRADLATPNIDLARRYGVSDSTICQVRHRDTWRHL